MKSLYLAAALLAASASFSCQALEFSFGVMRTETEFDSVDLDPGLKAYFTMISDRGIGLEVAHGKYGELDYSTFSTDFISSNVSLIAASSGEVVRFYGKLGAAKWEVESSHPYGRYSDDGTDWLLGFGMNIDIGALQLKMEVETLNSSEQVNSINAGIGLTF